MTHAATALTHRVGNSSNAITAKAEKVYSKGRESALS